MGLEIILVQMFYFREMMVSTRVFHVVDAILVTAFCLDSCDGLEFRGSLRLY